MLVDRDPSGDEEDRPLSLKLVKPRKRAAKKKEPAPLAARGAEGADEPADEPAEPAEPAESGDPSDPRDEAETEQP